MSDIYFKVIDFKNKLNKAISTATRIKNRFCFLALLLTIDAPVYYIQLGLK